MARLEPVRGVGGSWTRRLVLACAVGLATVGAAGCGADGLQSPSDNLEDIAPEDVDPAITPLLAEQAVDRYERISNDAHRAGDAERLAEAEAGSQLQRDTARLTKREALEPDAAHTDVFFEEREYFIPAGGEPWFLVSAVSSADPDRHQRLLTFAERGEDWKLVSALEVLEDDEVPEIELDGGDLAEAVPAEDDGLLITPAAVTEHVEETWEHRGELQGDVWGDTPALDDLCQEAAREPEDPLIAREYERATPEHPEVYALRTAGGGVLAIVPLGHTMTETVQGSNANLVPSEEAAVLGVSPQPSIASTFRGEAAAYLPPGDHRAQLVTYEYELTAAD
ncbi:hypothetical protein [Streptomyces sp. B6B3]|uniref:hypothetical protein n=1 Tax=Streptomyces sp. B6B3 TaxID=3153570 RepID=UPI00325D10A5